MFCYLAVAGYHAVSAMLLLSLFSVYSFVYKQQTVVHSITYQTIKMVHVSESIYILHIQDTLADRFYAILLTVLFLSVVCLEENMKPSII